MKKHRHLPDTVMRWFWQTFKHYLDWNKIKDYEVNKNYNTPGISFFGGIESEF